MHRTADSASNQQVQLLSQRTMSQSLTIAPNVAVTLGAWQLTLAGSYGRDETETDAVQSRPNGTFLARTNACFCNTATSVEIGGEGPLFALPGGPARLAVGGGYRRNAFVDIIYSTGSERSGSRSSRFAYGEVNLPLIGADQRMPMVHRLTMTGALRYEDYGAIGDILTPKLGLIYQPIPDVTLQASWGRSFKAPTLLQEFTRPVVYLWPAALIGATGVPAGSTVLMPYGGNPNLAPERAETWTATLTVQPRAVPGLRIEVSWFDVDYSDRVVQPIALIARTFIDPAYAPFIQRNPSAAEIAGIVAIAPNGVTNFSGAPFNPANIIAIADNRYANAARSRVSGIDLRLSYDFPVAGGRATVTGSTSWLDGNQQNSAAGPVFETVGFVSNPTEFTGRGGVSWTRDGLTLAGFVNHASGVTDARSATIIETDPFTTVDATVRLRMPQGRAWLSNWELSLAARNLLDQAPPQLTPLVPYVVNYDSTNFSAVGRFVTVSLTRTW